MQCNPDACRSANGAIFDSTQTYRYSLWRSWSADRRVGFVMLNPNQADATHNDPTIRRCIGFARAWGFGGLEVVNLFAYRAKTPHLLKQVHDPIGGDNDAYLTALVDRVEIIVLAWGNSGTLAARDQSALQLLSNAQKIYTLGLTKLGQPRHPLYLPKSSQRIPIFSGQIVSTCSV